MSDVQAETRRPAPGQDRRNQLLNRLQQISQSKQATAYGPVAQMLLDEIDPINLVSALLSQLASAPQSQTTPIGTGAPPPRRPQSQPRSDVARMA